MNMAVPGRDGGQGKRRIPDPCGRVAHGSKGFTRRHTTLVKEAGGAGRARYSPGKGVLLALEDLIGRSQQVIGLQGPEQDEPLLVAADQVPAVLAEAQRSDDAFVPA